jgi:hypothetical protein
MTPRCRFCGAPLTEVFADLGMSPLSNSYVPAEKVGEAETFYPLCVFVCSACLLVQLPEHETASAIFTDYAYLSSYSSSWLAHAENLAQRMVKELELGPNASVIELASNDGYLLQFFAAAGVPILGVEPAANVAAIASERGIPTEVAFFGRECAQDLVQRYDVPRLIVAINVLAHVPDLNDFVAGIAALAGDDTLVVVEFPHLLRLMAERQFDTIYHEHFSYFSLFVVERVFRAHGLAVFDVEELETHGGSLRVFARRSNDEARSGQMDELLEREISAGLTDLATYRAFSDSVVEVKCSLLQFLIDVRGRGQSIAGYGAPAKGNTLLNYCGIGPELLPFTVDRNPLKQGTFLPGSRIPVLAPSEIARSKPDFVLILPWNLRDEIMQQLAEVRSWGGKFVVPIPQVSVLT